jgi:hypothetical protein
MVTDEIVDILARYLERQAAAYAEHLIDAGFTVYVRTADRDIHDEPIRQDWFHYSRQVDGRTLYGTFHYGASILALPNHAMPVRPTREYGSSIVIADDFGVKPISVEYALKVTRPRNQGRHCGMRWFDNAEPWGIGRYYVDVRSLLTDEVDG